MVVLYSLVSAAWQMGDARGNMQLFPHVKVGQFLDALSIFGGLQSSFLIPAVNLYLDDADRRERGPVWECPFGGYLRVIPR